MYVKYDALNRHESLVLTLCNPGSIYADDAPTKVVGMLADVSDEEMVVNFNSLSELNFRTYKVWRDDAEADAYTHAMYKAVQPRRLLFVTGIGYFVISNVEEGLSEDGSCYKDVSAKSIESEIHTSQTEPTVLRTMMQTTSPAFWKPLWRPSLCGQSAKLMMLSHPSTEHSRMSVQNSMYCLL